MRIAAVTADWGRNAEGEHVIPGGASWARLHVPLRALEAAGHDVVFADHVASHRDGHLVPFLRTETPLMMKPDVVIVQRWMHRDAPDAIRAARAAGQLVIQEIDDWFWGLDPRNNAYHATDPKRFPDVNRDHYRAAVEASAVATVSTEFLAKRIRERFGTRTILLRNAIDPVMWTRSDVRDTDEGLIVGWTGSLHHRSGDLETLRGVLGPYLESMGGTFVHHGTHPADRGELAADRIGLTADLTGPTRPLAPPEDFPENVAGFDIGVVPLSDVAFNHAKSWIKGLEYAAAGIPFVAFRSREYEALGCGLLASTPQEWRAHLDALRDPQMRREQREIGLAVAMEQSISTRWVEWERAYLSELERAAA